MALAFSKYDEDFKSYPAILLAEYHFAHGSLLEAMARLDAITRGPVPSKDLVVDARWSISRASLTRRTLWSRAFTHLSPSASKENAIELRRLQESDMSLLRSSSQHVCKWKIQAVMSDWESYCSASRDIRWHMKAAIGAEKRVLYPMLTASADDEAKPD